MATTKLRRLVALACASALLALAACSGSTNESSSGAPSAGGAPSEINIIAPSNAPSDAGFQAVTDAFNAVNPDIKATYTPVTDYDTTRAAQLTAGTVDVFVCFPRQPQDFTGQAATEDTLMARAGQFVDLTNEPFMKNYTASVLASPRSAIDGTVYAVPTGLSYATGVYYNKKVFADNGLDVPTTWAELVNVMTTLKGAGVTPFGWGGLDGFPAALPLYGLVASYYPQDADKWELLEGLWDGSVDLTTGVPLEIMERLQVIYDNSSDTSPGISIVESFGAFANGEFAMLFDGSWDQKTILDVVDSNFEFGMFPLPGGDNAADNQVLNGKLELQLCVASASKNKEAALKWLEFYSQPENYTTFVEQSGFAPSQPNITTNNPFLDSIADYTKDFSLFWEAIFIAPQELAPEGGVGFAYNQLVPIGTKTPAEAAAAAEAAWDAVRA